MTKIFQLKCLAPDGATVREGEFETVQDAWNRSNDMGSRWFFYPVHIVTGACRSDLARIVDAPQELQSFIGKTVRTLSRAFAGNSQEVCDWVNGKAL